MPDGPNALCAAPEGICGVQMYPVDCLGRVVDLVTGNPVVWSDPTPAGGLSGVGTLKHIETMLLAQKIDIGLSTLMDQTMANIESRELHRLPQVLLVPVKSTITKASQIFEKDRIDLPLVSMDSNDVLSRLFQTTLRQRGLEWLPSLEVGSLDLVVRYVAEGFGAGLALRHPRVEFPGTVRALDLPDFTPLSFGALWTGRMSPLLEAFLDEAQSLARNLG